MGKLMIIKPSSWSIMDVACIQSWEQLKQAAESAKTNEPLSAFRNIESTPMLRRRDVVVKPLSIFLEEIGDAELAGSLRRRHDYVFTIRMRGRVPFPDYILSLLQHSVDDNSDVTSLKLIPVKTCLVKPANSWNDMSKASRGEIELGMLSFLSIEQPGSWFAEDLCTILKAESDVRYVMVLVHHQARPGHFTRRLELVCIPYSLPQSAQDMFCQLHWSQVRKAAVQGVSLETRGLVGERGMRYGESPMIPSYGRLRNGMPYFVDHLLLYSDGFTQYNFKTGSSGGVYCVSPNYPPHLRRMRERVRILALTPPGVSTDEGLRAIIPDLVKCCTEGVVVRNADGERVMLFLDIVGYVCDYHEVGNVLDVLGQNGSAACHLCSFLRFTGPRSSASRYGYSTTVHSSDACYARSGPRTEAIRQSHVSNDFLVSVGLKKKEQAVKQASPIFELYESLSKKMKGTTVPLTEEGLPVVSPTFDPYRSVFVAPDHLLAGIAINEMTLVFKTLPTTRRRKQAEFMMCCMLHFNGLQQESRIYHAEHAVMYSTSISGTFCRLLVAAPVFTKVVSNIVQSQEMTSEERYLLKDIVKNLCFFQKLVAQTYWYPTHYVDTPNAVRDFNCNEGTSHISSLRNMCIEYMKTCNSICKRGLVAFKQLDKPNLHRLLELYTHSIPALGHVHHFWEPVFECAHQPLKRAMLKSNFRDSHMQSMRHCIADDWKARIAAAYSTMHDTSVEESATTSLLNLLCGRQNSVWSCMNQDPALRSAAKELLKNDMLKRIIGKVSQHLDCRMSTEKWYLTDPDDTDPNDTDYEYRAQFESEIRDFIRDYVVDHVPDENESSAKFYRTARGVKAEGSGSSESISHPRSYETLASDMVLYVLLSEVSSPVLEPFHIDDKEDGLVPSMYHFCVEEFVSISQESCYAAVRKCDPTDKGLLRIEANSRIQLLKLTDAVRRTGLVHACDKDPILRCIQQQESSSQCKGSILEGNSFYFYTRREGYPPRMA